MGHAVSTFFKHAFALPGSGSYVPPPTMPEIPKPAPPATPAIKGPSKKPSMQQSFLAGASAAAASQQNKSKGKTLVGA